MTLKRTCDGYVRRDFLRVGSLTATSFSLANYLQMASAGEIRPGAKGKAAIFIDLNGGPSHIDTFDPKPEAGDDVRGKFTTIDTNVPGIRISEHLPKLAQCADKFAILRGVSHTLAAHRLGSEYVNTGSRPLASLEYPGFGAVVTRELSVAPELPPFVAIPRGNQRAGFLGIQYAPMNTGASPTAGQAFSVRGISLDNGMTVEQIERRQGLLKDLDRAFAEVEQQEQLLVGLNRFNEKAFAMITSPKAREAFDISREDPSFAKQFSEHAFSQSCLLAIRLVEAGVRFVSLSLGGWDTHTDNFTKLSTKLLPELDAGLSALYVGLAQRGLLDSTSVMCTGEFGRTPKINTRSAEGGRDHYPRCMFMLMAGGGMRGGQVIGESDDTAAGPRHTGIKPDDVAASFYHSLGIDHSKEFHTETGRPIMIVRDGKVIPELFA
ncbi:MAG: DUF1501 domain-containing protein [Planctomycetales bacterium]|nr:DUF1501 domain-containing protein [Planctomycetales bacterium]